MGKGQNFLLTRPDIAAQWDYERNTPFKPENFSIGSSRKYFWWKCSEGHSWKSDIASRVYGGNGCPVCSNKKILSGYNDLKTLCPNIAKEWDRKKNGTLKPTQIGKGSRKKVWWKCSKGHSWKAEIASRTYGGNGCPICANRKALKGYNDLQTLKPEVAEWWNYEKNGKLKPTQVTVGSNKRVWWKCPKGHEFEGKINNRARKKTGCPVCSNRLIIPGINDLQTLRPDLAAEWDTWQNKLEPTEVGTGSNKKVWWICANGHRWEARVNDRNKKRNGTGCPICSRRIRQRKKIEIDGIFT